MAISCAKKVQQEAIAPKEYYLKPDFKKTESTIKLLTSIKISQVEKLLNDQLPAELYRDDDLEDDNIKVVVTKVSPVKLVVENNTILWSCNILVNGTVRINLGFFTTEKSVSVTLKPKFKSKLSLDKNWGLQTQTEANGIEWISEPTLKAGPLEVSIKPFVEPFLASQQAEVAKMIDKEAAANANLKSEVEKGWQILQSPIEISQKPSIMAQFKPEEIFFIPISGDTSVIKTGIAVKGNIEMEFENKPSAAMVPLPQPQFTENVDSTFQLRVVSKVSFEKLNKLTLEVIKKNEFKFSNNGFNLEILQMEFYGSGEFLVAKCTSKGDYEGIFYLKSIPKVDTIQNRLFLTDVSFDLESRKALKQKLIQIAEPLISKKIEQMCKYDLNSEIESARKLANEKFLYRTIPTFGKLRGSIASIQIKDLKLADKQILLVSEIKGSLNFNLDFEGF